MFWTILAFGVALVIMLLKISSLENEVRRNNKKTECPLEKVRIEILKAVKEDLISLRDFMEKKIEKSNDRISTLAEKAESVNLSITQGVDALANHLKVEIIPFREEAKEGFRIEKLKKSKK